MPLCIILLVFSRAITLLLLGEKWVDLAAYLRIFAIAGIFRLAIGTSAIVLITCGKVARYLLIAVANSFVLCLFMIVGIMWGPIGVATAHVSKTLVFMAPRFCYSFLDTPVTVSLWFRTTTWPFFAGLSVFVTQILFLWFLPEMGIIRSLAIGSVVGV
jgi:O-antigen/teichoic acid export membrane protein